MSLLREFQSDFMNDIYDGTFESAKYLSDAKTGNQNRLRIYRNNTIYILTDALSDTFPVLKQLVGEKFFHMMAREYLMEFPQPSGNLFSFGEHLPVFLKTYIKGLTVPYLSDMAALEWVRHISYHADDIKFLTFDGLTEASSQNEDFILQVADTAHLINASYNVLDIWKSHQDEKVGEVALEKESHSILVWRNVSNQLNMMMLDTKMEQFFTSCKNEETFLSAMNDLNLTEDNQPYFQSEFARLMTAGVFTS